MAKSLKSGWRARAVLVTIALSAFIPFALAWYYASHPELIDKKSNYGSLILPARQIDSARILDQSLDAPEDVEKSRGRWMLLQVATGDCGQACADTLHKTHQGWLMLNKEMPRVSRVLLVGPGGQAESSASVTSDDALLVARLTPEVLRVLAEALGKPPGDGMVILVDPLGNLVLWYDTGFDPYLMVKDLKHLLKASQIG